MSRKLALILCVLPGAAAAPARPPQQVPDSSTLIRKFSADAITRYSIQLTVRSELADQQTETIGAKTYVQPFSRAAGRTIEWRATRRILSVTADGTAEIEETLDNFSETQAEPYTSGDPEAEKVDAALGKTFSNWSRHGTLTLRYRETRNGQLRGLEPAGVPPLEEAQPPLLALWLLRALRPTAALPARAVEFGDRWQEPRTAKLEGWSEVEGFESGEWLAAPETSSLEPAVRLLAVQQILGTIIAGPEKAPEGAARGSFHAESLSTFSLRDGRVLAATRSATREITWVLAPVAGLEQPPQFAARLSAQIEIEECHGACSIHASDSGRNSR